MSLEPVSINRTSSSLSFETILSWFGSFTPQFKYKLLSVRQGTSEVVFESTMREAIAVYRSILFDLSKLAPGAERARRTHQLIDQEFAATPVKNAACAAGCSACCRKFPKQISADDADLLAEWVQEGRVSIDRAQLKSQVEAGGQAGACLFLSSDNRCGVYEARPVVCRKYHVTSPAAACETDGAEVKPRIDLMPEIIASASLSLPDNPYGFMAILLDQKLD